MRVIGPMMQNQPIEALYEKEIFYGMKFIKLILFTKLKGPLETFVVVFLQYSTAKHICRN